MSQRSSVAFWGRGLLGCLTGGGPRRDEEDPEEDKSSSCVWFCGGCGVVRRVCVV